MTDAFVGGEKTGVKPAALNKALDEINSQSKSILNHFFFLAAGLILFFLVGLVLSLLCYRYLVRLLWGLGHQSKVRHVSSRELLSLNRVTRAIIIYPRQSLIEAERQSDEVDPSS